MDTWNRLTDLRGECGGSRDGIEICQRTHIHTYIAYGHRQQVVKARVGGRSWVEEGKCGGKWGTFVMVSTI